MQPHGPTLERDARVEERTGSITFSRVEVDLTRIRIDGHWRAKLILGTVKIPCR